MSSKHTKEPWEVNANLSNASLDQIRVDSVIHGPVAVLVNEKCAKDEELANASRIVACVNACEGINPEAVPDMLAVLKRCHFLLSRDGYYSNEWVDAREAAFAAIARAKGE